MLTAEQIKAGRSLINSKQTDLASRAGISLATLNNIERDIAHPKGKTLDIIENTLRQEGIDFINDVNGVGVVLKNNERGDRKSVREQTTKTALKLILDTVKSNYQDNDNA